MRDLVVLVADKDMEQAMLKLLQRPESLSISPVSYDVFTHPTRDSGCRAGSLEVLRPLTSLYRFALVMFDHEGSGGERIARDPLEQQVEAQLAANGWSDRCAALVLEPELEIWMWTDSPELDRAIGWAGKQPPVRDWLRSRGFAIQDNGKPVRPKEGLAAALRHVKKQPSPALFAQVADRAGLSRCTDPTFRKLKATLQCWFRPDQPDATKH